ncbi:MAG: glycosyltransferase family 39 protein [Pyrinomonadaceae bacterium]|nr:glycosyltransferase family 39 protein [Pyrinomonadaceae bacterium]
MSVEMFAKRENYYLLILVLLCGIAFFWQLGDAPLFDRDEGAFSEATREMFERKDFISPFLNAEPRHDKPVLTYWLQAIGVLLFGLNETGLRFHSAIAATCWIFATYYFTRKFLDEESAFVAAFLNATSLFVILIARLATADALLNLFIALSLFEIYNYFADDKSKNFLNLDLRVSRFFLWIALGFLTKGPVAIVIPFAVSLIFFATQKRVVSFLKLWFNPFGILIFAVVALPWFVVQTFIDDGAFLRGFFFRHNLERFETTMESHGGSIFYYVPILFIIVLPYSFWLFRAFFRIGDARRDKLDLFCWLWFAFVFAFFSISSTKLPHYILYGITPLFVLMSKHRNDLRGKFWALSPLILLFSLMFCLPFLIEPSRVFINKAEILVTLDEGRKLLTVNFQISMALGLILVLALFFVTKRQTWQITLISGAIFAFAVAQTLLPTFGAILHQPAKDSAHFLMSNNIDNIVIWKLDVPSTSVYLQRVTQNREPRDGEIVMTRIDKVSEIKKAQTLFQSGAIVILKVEEFR